MDITQKMEAAETRITKAVFPNTTNHYATLFGGTALQWMDEAAFITATRFSRQKIVTVCSDRIDFTTPIPAGTFVELIGQVVKVGKPSENKGRKKVCSRIDPHYNSDLDIRGAE